MTPHTKLITDDRRYLFVGSLNIDPRAIDISVLIDAPEMTAALAERFMTRSAVGVTLKTRLLDLASTASGAISGTLSG